MTRSRRRRGRAAAAAGAVVLAAGAATAAAVGFGGNRTGATDADTTTLLPPETATVTRETLRDTAEVPGQLGYGTSTMLPGRIAGVLTRVPVAGDVVSRGQPVYRVDNTPVVLMYGDVAAYRPLGNGDTGPDVRQLETNLKALGHGPSTVDDWFTAATTTAVRRWQQALGLPRTGRIELGRVLFAAGPIRIDTVTAGVNQNTGDGEEVLRFTGTGRRVTARLEVFQQRLARPGVDVRVHMPTGREVAGRVDRVSSVVDTEAGPGGEPETRIEALVSLADASAAAGIEAAVVTVVFAAAERPNVLTVPIAALVALAEGGYGVEVVEGSSSRHVAVETGLFANGRVEVTGEGLREGMTVGMPR